MGRFLVIHYGSTVYMCHEHANVVFWDCLQHFGFARPKQELIVFKHLKFYAKIIQNSKRFTETAVRTVSLYAKCYTITIILTYKNVTFTVIGPTGCWHGYCEYFPNWHDAL